MEAPIVLFVYNRLEHTKKTIEALQKNQLASTSELYIFADGPKLNATDEQKQRIWDVQKYVSGITGFKDVIVEISSQNKGLANSVIFGVTKVIKQHGKVIVVEDDIVTHPFFLRYMNDCLNIYKDRKDIYMIGGFNQNVNFPWWYGKDIYLTYRSCSWGWATWKNRWENADWNVSGYEDMAEDEKLQKKFNRGGDDNFKMLKMQMEGKIDSWCIRWDYCMFNHNAFCVIPCKSLVINCGVDGTGVHCGKLPHNYTAPFPKQLEYYFNIDEKLKFYPEVNDRLLKFLCGQPTGSRTFPYLFKKVVRKIVNIVKLNEQASKKCQ